MLKISGCYPADDNAERVSKYRDYQNEISFDCIDFPVKIFQIQRFERLNDISINVYGLKLWNTEYVVVPLFLTSEKKKNT